MSKNGRNNLIKELSQKPQNVSQKEEGESKNNGESSKKMTVNQILSTIFNHRPGDKTFSEEQIIKMIVDLSQENDEAVKDGLISFIIARFSGIIPEKDAAMLREDLIESPKVSQKKEGESKKNGESSKEMPVNHILGAIFNHRPDDKTFSEEQIIKMIMDLSQENDEAVKEGLISFIMARFSGIISEQNIAKLNKRIKPEDSVAVSNTGKGIDR